MQENLPFWAVAMLLSGGMFAGAAFAMSYGLAPICKKLSLTKFKSEFARNTKNADVVQPLLLVTAIISSIGYAASCHGMGVDLSTYAAVGYSLALIFTALYLMPLKKKILGAKSSGTDLDSMRTSWINGLHIRTALAIASFSLSCAAVAVHL